MDTHWNPSNAIYGDNPVKTSRAEDCKSLYPNINAIKQSSNQYSYCANNPVLYVDKNGEWIHVAIGAFIGGIVNVAFSTIDQNMKYGSISAVPLVIDFAEGAMNGALTSLGFGWVSNGIVSGLASVIEQAYYSDWDFTKVDIVTVVVDAGLSALGSKIGEVGKKVANSGHLNSMSKNLVKQVKQTVTGISNPFEKLFASFVAFFDNVSYYFSQTHTDMFREVVDILKSFIPAAIRIVINAWNKYVGVLQ